MNGSPLTSFLRFSGLILSATLALPFSGLCSAQLASPSDVSTAKAIHKTVHRKRPASGRAIAGTPLIHKAVAHPGMGARVTSASLRTTKSVATVTRSTTTSPIIRGGPWLEPTYADSTQGDRIDGEDLNVRRAAVEALGEYNGSVVVVDPSNGRVLTMVNQKEALSSGFQPCSTVKISVALAGLSEKAVSSTEKVKLPGGQKMDMTYALAHSINLYFATLGEKLGFEKVAYYSHLFGYGEKAGLNIAGEQPGHYPTAVPQNGGVGMLTSFGEEIQQTPLQLAALMSAIANGGTLYYLQYPENQADVQSFMPRVKRHLDIEKLIPEVVPGMRGAVEFGTAHRAREDGALAGKTGTCTNDHTHLGWFGSFNESGNRKLVVVVLLTGGRPAIGPMAAGIAGDIYRRLGERNYFASATPLTPASLIASQICCSK
jgi:penicillin-binding protein 2